MRMIWNFNFWLQEFFQFRAIFSILLKLFQKIPCPLASFKSRHLTHKYLFKFCHARKYIPWGLHTWCVYSSSLAQFLLLASSKGFDNFNDICCLFYVEHSLTAKHGLCPFDSLETLYVWLFLVLRLSQRL